MVNIVVEDLDPQRAALLANEVADAYIAENLALKLRITESATQWLEERRDGAGEDVQDQRAGGLRLQEERGHALHVAGRTAEHASVAAHRSYENMRSPRCARRSPALKARVDAIRQLQQAPRDDAGRWAEAVPGASESRHPGVSSAASSSSAPSARSSASATCPSTRSMIECNSKLGGGARGPAARASTNVVRAGGDGAGDGGERGDGT